jgi:hypothetical protein
MKKLIYAVAGLATMIMAACGGNGSDNDKQSTGQVAARSGMKSSTATATTTDAALPADGGQSIFVPSWDDNNQPTGTLMIDGLYTLTGKTYCNGKVQDSPACAQAMYIKVYSDKMVVTMAAYNSGRDFDQTYPLERVDNAGNRLYRTSNTDAFVVDSKGNIQRLTSFYTYNGNLRTDTYWVLVPGDHREEILKRARSAMDWENQKFILGIDDDDYGW